MRQPKASYDHSADALYIKFSEDAIAVNSENTCIYWMESCLPMTVRCT